MRLGEITLLTKVFAFFSAKDEQKKLDDSFSKDLKKEDSETAENQENKAEFDDDTHIRKLPRS